MGQERIVTFPGEAVPTWEAISELLGIRGFAVTLRMIDGELAFPDEKPSDHWSELRVGTTQGMVTVRHSPSQVRLVTWGNADAEMLRAWNALAWAYAQAGQGRITTEDGSLTVNEFLATADLPPAVRKSI
jgi:hypothetical protein